jgi:hypothetical protein
MTCLAADLAARHRLRRRAGGRSEWAGDCPGCGYAGAFTVREKDGRAVWWCVSCGSDRERLTAAVLGRAVDVRASNRPRPSSNAVGRSAAALRLWKKGRPAAGSPASVYLAGRGLVLPDGEALRWLPDTPHTPSVTRGSCMIALVTDAAGMPLAVHRTWLAPGGMGKAALDPPRMTLGPVAGGAVRLCCWQPGAALVIGEGIESSLAAGLIVGAPAWAALSAGNLARAPLPDGLAHVLIAADADAPGQRAAWAAADAFSSPRAAGGGADAQRGRHRLQRPLAAPAGAGRDPWMTVSAARRPKSPCRPLPSYASVAQRLPYRCGCSGRCGARASARRHRPRTARLTSLRLACWWRRPG